VGLVDVIQRLHTDFKLKFTLETLGAFIDNSVGVLQGDNMAPVLFLFLMQAVLMESLQLCWDDPDSDLDIRPIGFRYMPTAKSAKGQNGRLRLQPDPVKTKGQSFDFSKSLFGN
jgi:hypothetical protein